MKININVSYEINNMENDILINNIENNIQINNTDIQK